MTNSHNRTSAVATASSGRSPGDRYAHGTNLNNTSSSNHQSNNHHHHQQQQQQQSNHSNSITTLFGNNDGSSNTNGSTNNNGNISSNGGGGYFSNRKLNHHRNNPGGWHQRTPPGTNVSRCAGGNNLLPSSTGRGESRSAGGGNRYHHHGKTAGNHNHHHNHYYSHGRANGIQILMGGMGRRGVSPPTLLPSSLTHFASSKCFDAPAPTALPKPPQHWTTTTGGSSHGSANCDDRSPSIERVVTREKTSAKRSLINEFDTHNLKMILNVQS